MTSVTSTAVHLQITSVQRHPQISRQAQRGASAGARLAAPRAQAPRLSPCQAAGGALRKEGLFQRKKLPGISRVSFPVSHSQAGGERASLAVRSQYGPQKHSAGVSTNSKRLDATTEQPGSEEMTPASPLPSWLPADHDAVRRLVTKAVGGLGSLLVLLGAWGGGLGGAPPPAVASETITIMLPASPVQEVTKVQRALVETWGIVREAFFDPTFNHQDWDDKLQDAVRESFEADNAEQAYGSIRSMLASLDDPFTRIVTPREYEAFRITSDGALEGVGLVLAADPDSGYLDPMKELPVVTRYDPSVVITPIEGGPADRAGIQSGDLLLEIDHKELAGMDAQEAAKMLRGQAGTQVVLKLQHAAPVAQSASTVVELPELRPVTEEVELKRESIVFSPVYATLLPHAAPDGSVVQTGYIRLASFSQNAADDMRRAVRKLEGQGAQSFILDLRNNPGGLVKAGLDVAQMWLEGTNTLVNTVDRFGGIQTISAQDNNLHAITSRPLAVLVNKGSASASEILAGALHDNGRAMLVGETTYGKGRIQSVFELSDGTALFVTVAKYLSPDLHEIDRVGLSPDLSCAVPQLTTAAESLPGPSIKAEEGSLREASVRGPMAPKSVPSTGGDSAKGGVGVGTRAGVGAGGGQELPAEPEVRPFRSLLEEIQDDSCVITAERQLDSMASL